MSKTKRENCAFGVHFDIHVNNTGRAYIGNKYDPSEVEDFIKAVKPDYLQTDTKGHYGLSPYPTKVGATCHLDANVDVLKSWREITKKYGVALFAHHSSVFDVSAVDRHPEWAARNENGEIISVIPKDEHGEGADLRNDTCPAFHYISTFGPYVDEQLIPQLVEIANEYELDGVWMDGEVWANQFDYSVWAAQEYKKRFGRPLPKKGDEDYHNFVQFLRQGCREYIDHWTSEVHKQSPDFQIASAWGYTMLMPEKPIDNINFISGDFLGFDGPNFGRFCSRCMSNHGKPWDIMAWGVNTGPEYSFGNDCVYVKEGIQLCQEAAVALSVGGGFQYCVPQKNGGIPRFLIEPTMQVADFYRARQPFCFRAKHVHQVAVILSEASGYHNDSYVFNHSHHTNNSAFAALSAAMDNQYSAEVLMSYQVIERDISDYGLIIVPEVEDFEPEIREKLINYVENGGSLIIVGANSPKYFADVLGVEIEDGIKGNNFLHIEEKNGFFASMYTKYCVIKDVKDDVEVLNRFYTKYMPKSYSLSKDEVSYVATTVRNYGKGKIAGIYYDYTPYHKDQRSAGSRRVFASVMEILFPEPMVKVDGSHLVDVSIMTKDGKLCVNLVNMGGKAFSGVDKTFDELPPICDLKIEIAYDKAPKSVWIEPEHVKPDYVYEDGKIRFGLDRLDIHSVIVIE